MRHMIGVSLCVLCSLPFFGSPASAQRRRVVIPDPCQPSVVHDAVPVPFGKDVSCGTPLSCSAPFGDLESYIPTAATPIKIVELNFNILQKSDGSGNWKDTQQDRAALQQIADWMNGYYAMFECIPTDPCPGVVYPSESKIRISLEHIYFYRDTALWDSTNDDTLLAAAAAAHSDALQQLNVFFTAGWDFGASGRARLPSVDRSYDQLVLMFNSSDNNGCGARLNYAAVGTLIHELGHVFGLYHTYDENVGNIGPGSCEYLDDVFCPPINPIQQDAGFSCDPTLLPQVNSCTNNMMGGVRDACLFSPLQLGVMHRSLSITSAQKYVKPTACVAAPTGMALWLPFDESSGASAGNSPGKGGVLLGAPKHVAGQVKGGLKFDGRSQYVSIPDYPAINFGRGNFSAEAWVLRDAATAEVGIIADKRTGSGHTFFGYSFYLYNGSPGLQLADGGFDNYIAPKAVPADGNWHHVAVSVDRPTENGGAIYIDGTAVFKFDPRGHRSSLDNASPLNVGADTLAPRSSYFMGGLDEVVLYGRNLTAAEVRAMFQAGTAGRCKRSCSVPPVSFEQNAVSAAVDGQICNETAIPQAFMYWYEAVPTATCSVETTAGTPSFATCSDLIIVPAGACVSVATQVNRPAGFNNDGKFLCYRLVAQSLGDDDVVNVRCGGVLADFAPGPPH